MASIATQIGGNPIWNTTKGYVIILGILGVAIAFFMEGNNAIISAILMIPMCFFGLVGAIMLLISLINLGTYLKAKSAVRNGQIVPAWVVRNWICTNIMIVDETNRQLYIDGEIHSFSEVRETTWVEENKKAYVEVTLKTGSEPLKRVLTDNLDDARKAFARLNNALGFTSR